MHIHIYISIGICSTIIHRSPEEGTNLHGETPCFIPSITLCCSTSLTREPLVCEGCRGFFTWLRMMCASSGGL